MPWFGVLGGVIIFVGIVMVVVMGLMADFISESDRGKGLPRTSLFTKLCRTYAMSQSCQNNCYPTVVVVSFHCCSKHFYIPLLVS